MPEGLGIFSKTLRYSLRMQCAVKEMDVGGASEAHDGGDDDDDVVEDPLATWTSEN